MLNGRTPVLFFRDHDGDILIFAENNETNLNRMRKLALNHMFEISHWSNVLMVEQGDAWEKTSKGFGNYDWETRAFMLGGNDGVGTICKACPREWIRCGGFTETSPIANTGLVRRKNGLDIMGEALRQPGTCPIFDNEGIAVGKGSIERKHLRALGLEPVSSVRAFVENEELCSETDHEKLTELITKGVSLSDYESVVEAAEGMYLRGWLTLDRSQTKTTIGDLDFDPMMVETNVMAAKVRGGYANFRKKGIHSYQATHCSKCVYECEKPPWNLEDANPKPMTLERIMEFTPDEDALDWMALFTICGNRGTVRSHESGRQRVAIGDRPVRLDDGTWGIQMRACNPGYEVIAEMTVHEYWSEVHADSHEAYRDKYKDCRPRLTCDDKEKLAHANWALNTLADHTRWPARFTVSVFENNILYIWMNDACSMITIGSDTHASNYGGMNSRGGRIYAENRPRFLTSYDHPFGGSIWSWFHATPGSCRGREK